MTRDFGILKNPMVPLLVLLCSINAWTKEKKEPFLDDFRGTASVSHNGISLVSSFSLEEPALLIDLKFTKGKLSFEPDMRFDLEGKPWTFIFWLRNKAIDTEIVPEDDFNGIFHRNIALAVKIG